MWDFGGNWRGSIGSASFLNFLIGQKGVLKDQRRRKRKNGGISSLCMWKVNQQFPPLLFFKDSKTSYKDQHQVKVSQSIKNIKNHHHWISLKDKCCIAFPNHILQFYNSVFAKMSAVNVDFRNPFLRGNPYYVPQKYYSQEKPSNYTESDYSTYNSYSRYMKESRTRPKQPKQPLLLNTNNNHSRFQVNRKEGNVLKRKNINAIENPFYRKNLIPINKEPQIQEICFEENLEIRRFKLFESSKQRETAIENNNYLKIPSSKHITITQQSKENKPKYISSQLKIKLKSQTQLNPQISAQQLSFSPSKKDLVTLGRLEHSIQHRTSIQRCNFFPEEIQVQGKTFYLQQIL